ncbi:MAG: hypothetical protein GY789_00980 [Hyphomicrobiales bacterium]|nr:hypothetical protein [Hyphomicrobiales bacterium]
MNEANYPLVLGADVNGYTEVKGGYIAGEATVKYEITLFSGGGARKLKIINAPASVIKVVTLGGTDLAPAIRTSITNLMPTDIEYDTRAIMYMVGCELARCIEHGGQLTESCEVFPIASLTLNVGTEELIYSPPRMNGSLCVTVLALLAHVCGKDRLVVVAEEATLFRASDLDQREYITGLVTLANQFLMDAKMCGVFAQTLIALTRGACSVYKVHAHSDEGGYARNAARCADYPVPRGWVSSNTNAQLISEFSRFSRYRYTQVRADLIGLVLEFAGLLHDADPLAVASAENDAFVTIIDKKLPIGAQHTAARPVAWPELVSVMTNWHSHAVKCMAAARGLGSDEQRFSSNGFNAYCRSDDEDQHLLTEHMLPYLWVEACGVNCCPDGTRVPGPGGPRFDVTLPYMESRHLSTTRTGVMHEDNRGCVDGAPELLSVRGWSARMQGAVYIASSRFTPVNGLGLVKVMVASPVVTNLADSMSLSGEGVSLSEKLWRRSHCPVPHSGECSFVGDEPGGLAITHSKGTNMFSHAHHANKVKVTVGVLYRTSVSKSELRIERTRSRSALRMLSVYDDPIDIAIEDEWRSAIANIPQRCADCGGVAAGQKHKMASKGMDAL